MLDRAGKIGDALNPAPLGNHWLGAKSGQIEAFGKKKKKKKKKRKKKKKKKR
jgi:hypothetical protein